MTDLLIKLFIKDYRNVKDEGVRDSYGYLAGIVGMIANIILFVIKFIIGLITFSIAITADSFNNLSDSASSLITILGFKLSSKPADSEHPFGHGRIEYLSGLFVSVLVILVGVEFIKSSFNRILHPVKINFLIIPFLLIILSIFLKIWLSKFNKTVGNRINSTALKASSFDALSDVFVSSTTALSFIIARWTSLPIDGYIGLLVSGFILYSGVSLIRDTLDPLLGQAPDKELVQKLEEGVMSYNYISGVHDLIIHNYGPGRTMASLHAEVPASVNIMKLHEVIDKAERELSKALKLELVIHMDPINMDCKELLKEKEEIESSLTKNFPDIKSIHDFRIVGEGEIKNLIFDVVVGFDKNLNRLNLIKFKKDIEEFILEKHPGFNTVITIDRDFTK
ncbi:MAG: cation diffusion facilitator family transporter [Clostridiaceae bacterium]